MKFIRYLSENILFLFTLFLISFIPLYPKLPLLDIKDTWVYIRLEDFLVALAVLIFGILWIRGKATIRLPITIPVIVFWIVGLVATILGIIFIFPYIQGTSTNVGLFSFARRLEYLSVIFVAYNALRFPKTNLSVLSKMTRKIWGSFFAVLAIVSGLLFLNNPLLAEFPLFPLTVWISIIVSILCLSLTFVSMLLFTKKEHSLVFVLLISLFVVVSYGFGEKYYGLPAYLTMNEEFAKGIPLRLSALARIPSTFAGHYDLAAYLVLLTAIMGSLIFGFKKWYVKIVLFMGVTGGLFLLLMTASRVSFAVYLCSISFMLILQKKKILVIPVVVLSILASTFFQGITQRFNDTISQVDLVVDARTGKAVGIAKEGETSVTIEDVQSTGENLPKGTAYIKLPAGEEVEKTSKVVLKRRQIRAGTESAQVTSVEGNFVVQKVLAYDVSFTTRFQGQWPRAIDAFQKNIFFGSGYSSISLATDSNYLRILGEIGLFGFLSFFAIFMVAGIYIKKVLPNVDSPVIKSFVLGTIAGIFGLALNAVLIDVFEASKVAFVMWLLVGATLGLLHMYEKEKINYLREIKGILTSIPAIIIYLMLLTFGIFSVSFNNFFMGDDFTWLRWAADCRKVLDSNQIAQCVPTATVLKEYFFQADGFFYRPGTKVYFMVMYAVFGLSANAYHVISVLLHFATSVLAFLIALRFLKQKFFAFAVALFFLILGAHAESVFWVSATGHIIAAAMVLLSLLSYIYWKDTKNWLFLIVSILACAVGYFFHEFGIVTPAVIIFYDVVQHRMDVLKKIKNYWYYIFFLLTIPGYLVLRGMAQSHWFNGDYSYRLSALPFNVFGNILGYITLTFVGTASIPYYEQARMYGKEHVLVVGMIMVIVGIVLGTLYWTIFRKISWKQWQIPVFGFGFFIITLATFLGLGNITTRYVYLPSFGLLLIFGYVLQLLYGKIATFNKIAAIIFVASILSIFSYVQYQQLMRINADWHKAGLITSTVMKNFNDVFQVGRITPQNPVFYFVNVPMRTGEAWIFPVGLDDAMWFTFQNENLTVKTLPTLDMALQQAVGSSSARVFEFDKLGNVEEIDESTE